MVEAFDSATRGNKMVRVQPALLRAWQVVAMPELQPGQRARVRQEGGILILSLTIAC